MTELMESAWNALQSMLGAGVDDPSALQIAARTVLVYLAAVVLVRVGEKRFIGKNTAFDLILGIMFGSVLSRGINSSGDLAAALAAGVSLVGLHWLFAVVSFHSNRIGTLLKGNTRKLIDDGAVQWDQMQRSHISRDDLLGALRFNGNVDDPEKVQTAYLERSGDISVMKRETEPRVIEVTVEEGVQTVRIQLQ